MVAFESYLILLRWKSLGTMREIWLETLPSVPVLMLALH